MDQKRIYYSVLKLIIQDLNQYFDENNNKNVNKDIRINVILLIKCEIKYISRIIKLYNNTIQLCRLEKLKIWIYIYIYIYIFFIMDIFHNQLYEISKQIRTLLFKLIKQYSEYLKIIKNQLIRSNLQKYLQFLHNIYIYYWDIF